MRSYLPAIRYMLLSTLSFALMNALVKQLIDYSTFQLIFFRAVGSLAMTTAFLKTQKIPLWGNQKALLILRGLAGVTSMFFFFFAAASIAIGNAVTLRYTAPIFAAVLAVIFLREKIKHVQWLFFLIAFAGVFLIKGFEQGTQNAGVILALVSSFFSAVVYILISKIGKRDHPVVVVHYFMLISTIVGGIGSFFTWKTPVTTDWLLLLVLGVFGYFGQVFMTKAFQNTEAYLVAPFKYVEVIFTLSFGIFIFQETYTFLHILGMALIIFGLVLNVAYKAKRLS